jgi:multidrug transporter EmrE-like cation transporter
MKLLDLALILVAVLMSAGAQFALKLGMSSEPIQAVLLKGSVREIIASIALSPLIVLGLAVYAAGVLIWLFVLAKVELSLAYPFVGIGFIATMLLGAFLLNENLSLARIAGTLLICAGCALVARSG